MMTAWRTEGKRIKVDADTFLAVGERQEQEDEEMNV